VPACAVEQATTFTPCSGPCGSVMSNDLLSCSELCIVTTTVAAWVQVGELERGDPGTPQPDLLLKTQAIEGVSLVP
jgi:hypothetical protein